MPPDTKSSFFMLCGFTIRMDAAMPTSSSTSGVFNTAIRMFLLDGKVTNSVVHTLTRFSENEKQNIDQDMLLDMAVVLPELVAPATQMLMPYRRHSARKSSISPVAVPPIFSEPGSRK